MSDVADQASQFEEAFTQRSIDAVVRQAAGHNLPFKGFCHNCSDPVEEPKRFCDADCREDWDYVQKRKRANGLA